jgi:hypothetical protein
VSKVKTLAEHLEYVEAVARLSFSYAWSVSSRLPDMELSDIIRRHTMLYYHILNLDADMPRQELQAVKAEDIAEFEELMWHACKDFIIEKASAFYPDSIGMPGYIQKPRYKWNCGSLKYDEPHAKLPGYCVFHIANGTAPRSIFDVPGHLLECFEKLLHDSEKEYGYQVLYTKTWLNDKEEFLYYFPEEWRQNRSSIDRNSLPSWNIGDWGQLITARGLLNPKTAAFLRQNGYLPYASRKAHCSFASMREHLKSIRARQADSWPPRP